MADTKLRVLIESLYQDKGTTAAEKALSNVGKAGGEAEAGLTKANKGADLFGGALTKLVAGGALLTIGKQLLDFGKASIAVASDVEEAASKFQYTFGPAAEDVGNRLDEFAAAANRSRFEMRQMAADVGALTESTLGSKEAAGDMSVAITKLAVDLASFNNVTEDEALTALRAGLIGEAEPMRRFGVLLSAAAVEQRVLADGMANTKKEITESMKMQARYNIIMEQTATAQGDAERTSDSYANTQRGMDAAVQDLSAAFGQMLLPAATEATGALAGLVGQLATYVDLVATAPEKTKAAAEAGMQQVKSYEDLEAQLKKVKAAYDMSRSGLGMLTGTHGATQEALRDVLTELMLNVDSYEDFIAATDAAGISTTDLRNIILEFEPELRGNTEAWYEYAKATEESTRQTDSATHAEMGAWNARIAAAEAAHAQAAAQSAANAEAGAWEGRAAITAEAYAAVYGAAEGATRGVGGFTNSLRETNETALEALTPMQEILAAMAELERAQTTAENFQNLADNQQVAADKAVVLEEKLTGVYTGLQDTGSQATDSAGLVGEYIARLGEIPSEVQTTLTLRYQKVGDPGGYQGEANDPTRYAPGSRGNQGMSQRLGDEDFDPLNKRAMGGPVIAGTPYLVGERGPEIFTPNSSGGITPNNQIGGGFVIQGNVIIHAQPGQNGEQLYQEFSRAAARDARLKRQ